MVHTKTDEKYQTHQWLDPNKCLSYQKPQQEFEIFEEDFKKVVMDYILFENGVDVKTFNDNLLNKVLYQSEIEQDKLVLNLKEASDE